MLLKYLFCLPYCKTKRVYIPVGWKNYAKHGKARGQTFFSDKRTVAFLTEGNLEAFSWETLV